MRFLSTSTLLSIALSAASLGRAATLPVTKRQIVVPESGTTVNPADGSTIVPGATFPFKYENRNYCESGYSLIYAYLSTAPPTDADVTSSGELADGSSVYTFGDFLIPNFGLPPMSSPPPPPATLTAPTLDVTEGSTLYLSIVETYRDCPGGISLEFGLETTTVVYGQ